ncbi:MAG: hypothetical protein Q8O33_09160 [Pseudomonadota bacterium]|nr:hypothetical protein [Pseudomonadota bacterium]
MSDLPLKPKTDQPDALRRRLTKGGLAAPVILATLASKPVLGAAWSCTISGQVSGNLSGHESEVCSNLGRSPATWDDYATSWPQRAYFFTNLNFPGSRNARLFKDAPATPTLAKFADAFTKLNQPGTNATVWDVIIGAISVRAGSFATVDLGKEALAALLNALDGTAGYPAYPVSKEDVIYIFNQVATTGSYMPEQSTVPWYAADVIRYFRSLHP